MANIKECESIGLSYKVVSRFENRLNKLLKDMYKHKLYIFCGSAGTVRYYNDDGKPPLIVGHIFQHNHDGGCGAVYTDENGLERGES